MLKCFHCSNIQIYFLCMYFCLAMAGFKYIIVVDQFQAITMIVDGSTFEIML